MEMSVQHSIKISDGHGRWSVSMKCSVGEISYKSISRMMSSNIKRILS